MSLKKKLKKAGKSVGKTAKTVGRTVARAATVVLPIVGGIVAGPVGAAIGGAGGAVASRVHQKGDDSGSRKTRLKRSLMATGASFAGSGMLAMATGSGLTGSPLPKLLGMFGGGGPNTPAEAITDDENWQIDAAMMGEQTGTPTEPKDGSLLSSVLARAGFGKVSVPNPVTGGSKEVDTGDWLTRAWRKGRKMLTGSDGTPQEGAAGSTGGNGAWENSGGGLVGIAGGAGGKLLLLGGAAAALYFGYKALKGRKSA